MLASPRPVDTTVLAFSPLRLRYLQPFDEHVRGGSGSYVVDAAIERVERDADGFRIRVNGTTLGGPLVIDSDERDRRDGVPRSAPRPAGARRRDGQRRAAARADAVLGERLRARDLLRRERHLGSPGLRKHGATSNSTSVNGFRYNARVIARHIAEKHFGLAARASELERDEVVPYLLRSSRVRPSSGSRRAIWPGS